MTIIGKDTTMKGAGYFLTILAAVVFTGCGQSNWSSRDFELVKSTIDTVSILPPFIEYSIKSGEVKKVKAPHSRFVSGRVGEIFKSLIDSGQFISKSAVIVHDSVTEENWNPDEYLRSLVRYRQLSDSLVKVKNVKRSFPVSPELQIMVDRVSTRYFLFISGAAFGSTEASKLYDMVQSQSFKLFYDRPFIYESHWTGVELKLFLVDKATNEILWCNASDPRDTVYDPGKDTEIETLCKKLINEH